ncbi:arsenate reductase [Flavobacterium sp. MAH-1]|uniref:Arsenate reductase n=1 Tax=Flavobacterium agri TaxID=2743471 RepID=A0A7Y9C663_9FLAO|nr:ArsC/Spx/MgsR family protein [Flavobacterium agri]NUY80028.1 arsenate reductase [Flavobacterium agri]NYA70053.1 arsenate reductase [Flavobacterium agri]
MLQIYHNNRCSKSRECVVSLDASETPYETIDYLRNPLKFRQIKALLKKLKLNAIDIVRTNETEWAAYKGLELSNDDIVRILAKHPILMQRPIVVNGDKAVVARPLEKISEIV